MDIKKALSIGDKGVVSIVGAGGKTSLMYSLAAELSSTGKKVLTTTTTKIFMPTNEESPVTIISKTTGEIIEKARSYIGDCSHITLGADFLPLQGKLRGLHPEILESILESDLFDYILIEADGAARKSLKACAGNEPVVPEFTEFIISLAGVDVVGKPLKEEWVFRSDIFSKVTGLTRMQRITESSIAEILIHDMNSIMTTKTNPHRIAFLNKADNSELMKVGNKIIDIIQKKGKGIFHKAIVGKLKEETVIHRCINFTNQSL